MSKEMTKKIYLAENLDVFKKIPENRQPSASHVRKLFIAMSKKELTIDIPILVTKNYEVLDGQHRLEAARQLKIPIYYQFAEETTKEDIPTINSINKKWTSVEYLHKYIEQGNWSYKKFDDFMQKNKIRNITLARKLLNNWNLFSQNSYINNKGKLQKRETIATPGNSSYEFNNGDFIYPSDDSFAYEKIQMLKDLSIITINNDCFELALVIALDCLLDNKEYNHERMKDKIKKERSGGYATARELVEKLEKCYNQGIRTGENYTVFRKP